jgi:hypothetical protein
MKSVSIIVILSTSLYGCVIKPANHAPVKVIDNPVQLSANPVKVLTSLGYPMVRTRIGYPMHPEDYDEGADMETIYWPNQVGRYAEEDGAKWDAAYSSCVNQVFPYIDSLVYSLDVEKEFQRLYVECMWSKGYKHPYMF